MEPLPPSIFVQNPSYGSSYRPSNSFTSQSSSIPFQRSEAKAMSIPNNRGPAAPPPLPPPRYLKHEINAENDPGWVWQNSPNRGRDDTGSHPVSPTHLDDDMDLDERYGESRRGDSSMPIKHSPSSDLYLKDEGYHSLSGSSLAHRYLQGERPLAQRNSQDASHAYDRNQLSRIGKPRSPPRSSLSEGMDSSPISQDHAFFLGKAPHHQLKHLSLSDRSLNNSSESPLKVESPFGARWTDSPQSAVASPGLISSSESFMNYRSPSYSSASGRNGSTSFSGSRSDEFAWRRQQQQQQRRCDSDGAILLTSSFEEGANASSFGNSKRESIDQSILTSDLDDDFPIEETGGMRHLHLDDRMSTGPDATTNSSNSPESRLLGTKRKASSPVRDNADSADDKAAAQLHHIVGATSSDSCQRRTSAHLSTSRASPVHRYRPQHGSVSSTSSGGLRTGSYASSAALSVGGSSITSFSSHDRHSPGVISPLSEYHDSRDSPYVNNALHDQSPRSSVSRPHQRLPSETKSTAALARKMSSTNIPQGKQNNSHQLQSNIHICDCCPKKPKKFDTLEELHNHQLEKQYTCQFCHNRFKNKNEAERHQNSLHLRRHSWSCATLNNSYASAFHPGTAIPSIPNANHPQLPPSGAPSPDDVCGYCGQHFSNNPQDWDARIAHLNQVHKFGECNQSKKFFRADHFRQHLKHSHAGTSGKWTNMLESACMKDEPQPPMTPEALGQEQMRMAQQASAMTPMSPAGMPPPGAPVANMMGSPSGSRQGSFQQQMQMGMASNNELQYQKIEEEMSE